MQSTAPIVEERDEQAYVGIRTLVTMRDLDSVIPGLLDEVAAWLERQGLAPQGPPLIRYHAIDMDTELDITLGFPVTGAIEGDGCVMAESLPAGRYAALTYTGVDNGIQGNGALIDWIAAQGLRMDYRSEERKDLFSGRVEFLIDGPEDDPDPSQWRTEVAIRLA